DMSGDEIPDSYQFDPRDPTPLEGGAIQMPNMVAGVRDQSSLQTRNDVLIYTSEPLSHDMEVTGQIVVWLWANADSPDVDFVARLIDVHPNGFSQNLTDGIIRARLHYSSAASSLEPSHPYELKIDLWATANLFKSGHCIQLQIASACFPRWDLNPNNRENL